jgi:Dolichyl-phosphate-mannose-protein mannosyltransferase
VSDRAASLGFAAAHVGPGRAGLLLIVLAEAVAVVAILCLLPREIAVSLATLLLGAAILFGAQIFLPSRERDPLLLLTAVGLTIRLLTLILVHRQAVTPMNPDGFMFPDSFGYDRVGEALAQHWRHGTPPRLEYQTAGYTIGFHYVVAGIYYVFGHVPFMIKILNMLLSASLVPLTFLLGRALSGRQTGLLAAGLVALWPPLIFWSTQILKDMLIVCLLLAAALSWVSFARRPRLLTLAAAVILAAPLVFLRTYMFLFWMTGLALGLFALAWRQRHPLLAVLLAVLVAGAGIYAGVEYTALKLLSLDVLISRLSSIGTGGLEGSFFEGVAYRSLGDVLAFLPQGLVRFLVSPLPWKTSLAHWHEAVGSVLRYVLLPFAAIGMVVIWRRERWAFLPILITLFLGAGLYAIAFRGGGPRHMTQFYPYFLVCAAAGLPRFPNWPLPLALGFGGFIVAALAFVFLPG